MQIVLQKNLDTVMFHCLLDAKESSKEKYRSNVFGRRDHQPPPRWNNKLGAPCVREN